MNAKSSKGNGNTKKKRNKFFAFFKVLFISLSVFLTFAAVSWIMAQNYIKPPEIPKIELPVIATETVFIQPETEEEEDLLINKGVHAPEGFTSEDRKELFYTFLIVGIDGSANTDTIMVASYDGVGMKANVIGIARDSLVNVKRRVKKINAAYPAGTLNGGGKEGGIDQLKREIKSIIGFTPDFYVLIDMNAFVQIVDAVGGIEIDVPFDMKYDDPAQNLHINIKQGLQTLNGEDAIKFARYRKGNKGYKSITDYERIENQQAVISAIVSKLLKPANLLKIQVFNDIFVNNVYCDIKLESLLWFAEQLNNISGSDALSVHTMPTSGTSGAPDWYEYLDKDAVIELINETINPFTKDIGENDVDILGG